MDSNHVHPLLHSSSRQRWPCSDICDQCLYISNRNTYPYVIYNRRPGKDVKLSEEEGRSGVAGRARFSALQNFGIFPDSGVAYTPHRPKIAGYLSTKEILHTGMTSQKPKLGGRRGRGMKLLIKLFFPRGFLMRLVSMYAFSCIRRDDMMPMSSYD